LHSGVGPEDFAVEVWDWHDLPVGMEGATFKEECDLAGNVARCGINGQDFDCPIAFDAEA